MKRTTWVLLGVIGVLLALILLWERKQPTTAEREEDKLKILDLKVSEVVALTRLGDKPLELSKLGEDRWELARPLRDVADRYGIEGFLERLGQTRAVRFVEADASPASLGLDKPKATWMFKTPSASHKVEVGGRARLDEGLYLCVDGKTSLVPADLETVLLKPADDFRLKNLTTIATQEVKSFTYSAGPEDSVSARRDPKAGWLVTAPFQDWGSASAIEEMLDDVSLCLVENFLPQDSDPKTLGLAPPSRSIRIETEKGGPVEIALGFPVPGGDSKKLLFASVTGRPTPMTVSANGLRFLGKKPESLRSLDLFSRDAYDAEELGVSGGVTVVLKRSEEAGWQVEGAAPKGISDPGGLPAALASLKGESVVPWQGTTTPGFGRVEYTFTMKGPGFEQSVAVGQAVEGRRMAHPEGRPAALLLARESWETVEAALKVTGGTAPAPNAGKKGGAP